MPITLTKRLVKGSELTATDHDTNMTDIENAVATLESAVTATSNSATNTYIQSSAPTAPIPVGSLWINDSDGNRRYRWNGTTWIDITRELGADDFGTGVRPVQVVASLPTLPDASYPQGAFVFRTSDNTIHRSTGAAWTDEVDVTQIVGQLVAGQIAAGVISSTHVGTNLLVTNAANIGTEVVEDSHIKNLSADKIDVGDLKAVNIEADAMLYDDAHQTRKFHAHEIKTATEASFSWGACDGGDTPWSFTHGTALTMYGQGHASGTPILRITDAGTVQLAFEGRLPGYGGVITVYYRRTPNPYTTPGSYSVLGSWDDTGSTGSRITNMLSTISGLNKDDILEFYVAPCNGAGVIPNASPVNNVTYELDINAQNWA